MVTQWGMSDELGPVGYGENEQEVFLGHSITQTQERLGGDGAARSTRRSAASSRTATARPGSILTDKLDAAARAGARRCSSTRR